MAEPSRGLYLSSYPGISLRGRRFRTWRPRGLRPDGRRPPFDLARVAQVAPRPWREVRALVLTVRGRRLRLVRPLRRSIVPLVKAPAAPRRDPGEPDGGERGVSRFDRPHQPRGVHRVGRRARLFHQPPGLDRLLDAVGAERNVMPAGEKILEIPRALPVPEQHKSEWFSQLVTSPLAGHAPRSGGHFKQSLSRSRVRRR